MTMDVEKYDGKGALPGVLARISAGMPEIRRATRTAGRRGSQFVAKQMNVFLLGRTPYAIMHQCLAKIENARQALDEAIFRREKSRLLAAKAERKADSAADALDAELLRLRAEKLRWDIEQGELYVAGALKNIANYMSIYEQVKAAAGIADDWDELDYERAEAEHHIKQAFLQSLRDMVNSGSIGPGNQEYLENCGIGGILGKVEIREFLNRVGGPAGVPTMAGIEKWLEAMWAKYHALPGAQLRRHGIEPIDEWYIYLERNRDGGGSDDDHA